MELISVAPVRTKERRYKYCRFDGNAYNNLANNPTCEISSSGIYMMKLFIEKNPTRCNSVSKFIIPYLYEGHHNQKPKTALAASGLHTWKVVGRVVVGR
jgi:hypothetical protein